MYRWNVFKYSPKDCTQRSSIDLLPILGKSIYDTKVFKMTTNSASPDEQSTTSLDSTPLPPTETLILTDRDKVNEWLRKEYLSYNLEDGTEAKITIEEFLDIVRMEYPDCYMPEQTVTLALALSVKKWERSNTIVISDVHAQKLYALGTGIDTQAEVLRDFPTLQQTLLNPQQRWIIIPCNDGVLNTARIGKSLAKHDKLSDIASDEASPTFDSNSVLGYQKSQSHNTVDEHQDPAAAAQETQESNSPEAGSDKSTNNTGPEKHGSHWGLLVIDKKEKVARWVDSITTMVEVETPDNPTQWRFQNMHPTARAAGKILCGFDTLLGEEHGFPQGGFTTGTLKWNPNQWEDNASGGDQGPCGPFMFAFLEYILERATTLDSVGVSKMFPRSQKGRIQFDSIRARHEIRRLIQQEGVKPDAKKSVGLPFGLTSDILRILMPVEQFQQSIDVFQGKIVDPIRPSSNRPTVNRPSDPIFLYAFAEAKRENPDTYKGMPDTEAMALFYNMQQSALKGQGNKPTGGGKSNDSKTVKPNEFYLGEDQYRNVPSDDLTIWPEHDTDSDKMPGRIWRLPDFTVMGNTMVASWFNKSPELHDHRVNKKLNDVTRFTARALLHHKFKRTFLDQSDTDFERTWAKDQAVFDPQEKVVQKILENKGTRLIFGRMRLKMMRHYEGAEAVESLLKVLQKYKVKAPTKGKKDGKEGKDDKSGKDESSNSDSSDDENKPNGKGNPNGPSGDGAPDARPDNGDLFNSEYQNGPETNGSGGPAGNHVALQSSAAFQAIANHTIDFASMNEQKVIEWIHKTAGHGFLTSDTDLWERRVRLQRAFGGFGIDTTSKETAADYRGHLGLDDTLGLMQIISALNQRTNNVPDLRGQIQWYPDYYLQEHGVIPAVEHGQSADNQDNPSSTGSGGPTGNSDKDATKGNNINNAGAETNAGADGNAGAETNTGAELILGTRVNTRPGTINGAGADAEESTETGSDNNARPATGALVNTNTGANTNAGSAAKAEYDDTAGNESNSEADTNSTSLLTPMPEGILNFRTMKEKKLMKYVSDEMRQGPRVTNIRHGDEEALPNVVSWRAMCFVDIAKGRFRGESDKDVMDLWHKDPLVFNRMQREMRNYKPEIIKEMMANHYYRKDWSKADKGKKEQQGLELTQYDDFEDIFGQFSDDDEEGGGGSTEEDPDSPNPPADASQASTDGPNNGSAKRKHNGGEDSPAKKLKQTGSSAE